MSDLTTHPLDEAIRLRWVLRDIRAQRLLLSPVSPDDIETLRAMGYVEGEGKAIVLTPEGHEQIGG